MKHVALTLAVVVTLVLCPHQASAQSWVYVTLTPWVTYASSTLIEVPLNSTGLGSPQRQISLPGRAGRPVVTSDGRYVVFSLFTGAPNNYSLAFFDRRSGTLGTLPGFTTALEPVSDPTAPRLFFIRNNSITVLDAAGQRTLAIPTIDTFAPVLSSDGRELFAARSRSVGAGTVYHVVVLDPQTGVERRTLPELPQGRLTSMVLSHDRQRLYVTLQDPVAVRVLDANSGTELLSRGPLSNPPAAEEFIGDIHIDDRNNRLFLSDGVQTSSLDPTNLYILDASTLEVIGTAPRRPTTAVDGTLGLVVTARAGRSVFEQCGPMDVDVWGASPAPLASFRANVVGRCPLLAIATPPDAPTNLTHTVDGRRVTFNWSSIPGATGYVIEAGSSSGGADLGRIQTTQPSFDLALVPPGIYFVRARALNDVGPSAPSNEVIVNVQ